MGVAISPLLMIGIFTVFAVLAVSFGQKRREKGTAKIRGLAEKLGLTFTEPPRVWGITMGEAKAAGTLRGKPVEVFSFTTGSGKSRVQWCAASASWTGSSPLTFRLRRQGLGTKFLELFGTKEIQVGDAQFDRDWFIQCSEPEFFREALLPEYREKITAFVRELGASARSMEFKLEKNVVRYAEIGVFSNADTFQRCERALDLVCDLAEVAEVFAEPSPGP